MAGQLVGRFVILIVAGQLVGRSVILIVVGQLVGRSVILIVTGEVDGEVGRSLMVNMLQYSMVFSADYLWTHLPVVLVLASWCCYL